MAAVQLAHSKQEIAVRTCVFFPFCFNLECKTKLCLKIIFLTIHGWIMPPFQIALYCCWRDMIS